MDKSLLLFRGGVRSTVKKLSDGQEHTLYYKARTPNELAAYLGAERRGFGDNKEGDIQRQKMRAQFIAESLCNEDGTTLLTVAEAELIPNTLKPEICQFIVEGSEELGDTKKD